jgi:hypothetical protein
MRSPPRMARAMFTLAYEIVNNMPAGTVLGRRFATGAWIE